MPSNPYASAYINAAYERMVAAVQAMTPPAFGIVPTSEQFGDAANHVRDQWVSAIDNYIASLAREAGSNAQSNIGVSDRQTILSDALHDSGLAGELQNEADALAQDEDSGRDDYAEHNIYSFSMSGAK